MPRFGMSSGVHLGTGGQLHKISDTSRGGFYGNGQNTQRRPTSQSPGRLHTYMDAILHNVQASYMQIESIISSCRPTYSNSWRPQEIKLCKMWDVMHSEISGIAGPHHDGKILHRRHKVLVWSTTIDPWPGSLEIWWFWQQWEYGVLQN